MASDYFLKLHNVTGESKDALSPGSIEVSSFSWGVSQTSTSVGATGGGSGKAAFQPMKFVAPSSSASTALLVACASGTHIPKATLTTRAPGGDGTSGVRSTYELTDCVVSEYFVGGPADDASTGDVDTFALSFRKVTMTVNGAAGAKGVGGWDLATNKKV